MSFKSAAIEFHVTEGAISRQIKVLENYYGQPLFERVGRGVRLTDTGRRLLAVSSPAIQNISQVSEKILGYTPPFTLSVTTSFAIRWLMPRLSVFESIYPNYPINVQADGNTNERQGRRSNVSIVYVLGDPYDPKAVAPDNSQFIMGEWLMPVCSPALLAGGKPKRPSEMEQFKLIFNELTGRDWRLWLEFVPEAKVLLDTAIRFEHDDTAIQAAVAGHGVALANMAYIGRELQEGRLVPAICSAPIAIGAHYLIIEPESADLPYVKAFSSWLLERAAEFSPERIKTPSE
jgi:LysR family glycine cleavage system transcriptional activator